MSYGPVQVFSITTMASGATLSSAVDLQKAYNKISLVVPSMASGTDIYLHGSTELAGTYRRINHSPNSVSATAGALFISSSISNCIVPLNNLHVQYVKVELSTAMTATTAAFKLICSD
jgi:hypothetical protein